jgi:transcription elongation factor Elf1
MRFSTTSLDNQSVILRCNVCGLKFEEKWVIRAHRKLKYIENGKVCKYFIKEEEHCWFRHTDAAAVPQTLSVFKCNLCGKSVEFMVNRKYSKC